jgi:hypothetical protein
VNSWINLSALWRIVVIGLLAGAGLPALFALGLRALNPAQAAAGAEASAEGDGRVANSGPVGIAAASLCFLIILAAIAWGIYTIVEHS